MINKLNFIYSNSRTIIMLFIFLLFGCEPIVTKFESVEDAILYRAKSITTISSQTDTLVVMTWNIRFGAGRIPWFGDGCGERVILTESEVQENLRAVADKINEIDPDVLLLQEVDRESKRTAYIDQIQWLLDQTNFNYGAYASIWNVQFIPSDGLGRMDLGNAVFSKWEITDAVRIPLQLRGDQDALTQYFYLRRNILKTKINVPGYDDFYAVDVHATAFATDDTKQNHLKMFKDKLDELHENGAIYIAGGDLNEIPPGADSTDFCDEDRCRDERDWHADGEHREGSYFTPEIHWMDPIFESDNIHPAVSNSDYINNELKYFTHGSLGDDGLINEEEGRKIDYLFSNMTWVTGSDSTHQDALTLSDHTPVVAKVVLPE